MECDCPSLCYLRDELCAIDPESSSCKSAQEAVVRCECICPQTLGSPVADPEAKVKAYEDLFTRLIKRLTGATDD